MVWADVLRKKIEDREARICVIGLGRVGLPLAVQFASQGFEVIGVEVDGQRAALIRDGHAPFFEAGLEESLGSVIGQRLYVTGEVPKENSPDVFLITVGTPLSDLLRPDLSQLEEALRQIVPSLGPGKLVVLRSTVPPRTVERVVLPALRRHGQRVGEEIFVAMCPERIAEGQAMEELRTLPEICGGVDEVSTEVSSLLFRMLGPKKRVLKASAVEAELAKLFGNVYRYVMFALANEFAMLAEQYGVDARRVIFLANTDYPRGGIPVPGPAGGPCLVKDGYLLVQDLTMPDFVIMAWKLNEAVPAHIVRRVKQKLRETNRSLVGSRVCVLGKGFKRNSDDARYSPAVRIADLLIHEGAHVTVHDPYFPGISFEEALRDSQVVVLATNHDVFQELTPEKAAPLVAADCLFVDCWGILDEKAFRKHGYDLIVFGEGES